MTMHLVVVENGDTNWGRAFFGFLGCIAVAETRNEALQLFKEAIRLHIADLKDRGETVPRKASEGELVEAAAM